MNAFYGIAIATSLINGLLFDWSFWTIYFLVFLAYSALWYITMPKKDQSKRKNIMISTWNETSNPTGYIVQDINVEKALAHIKATNEAQSEVKVTMTHVMAHAIAWGMYKMRRDIGRMTFGYFTHSKEIGMTTLVDVEGGSDLVPVTVWDGHKMTLIEFAKAITEKVQRAKNKKDKTHD